jgi:hypothetical protein
MYILYQGLWFRTDFRRSVFNFRLYVNTVRIAVDHRIFFCSVKYSTVSPEIGFSFRVCNIKSVFSLGPLSFTIFIRNSWDIYRLISKLTLLNTY